MENNTNPYGQGGYSPNPQAKSRFIFAILTFVLGAWGLNWLYLGHVEIAKNKFILMIIGLLLILACGIGTIMIAVLQIIALVDVFKVLSGTINEDAHGIPFKD
ncbi:MAG: hypothetical protein FWC09_12125 [Lachnospiraceae bacterium]|nr:hypothetical protein [Lachnospiraceae bacterium]